MLGIKYIRFSRSRLLALPWFKGIGIHLEASCVKR